MRVTTLLPALASAALLLSGTAALAQQNAPATTTAEESGGAAAPAPAAKPKKERKICREDPNSYSHMVGRVCKTQAEWDNAPKTRQVDSHVTSSNPNN
jgi:hypothetical protein